MTMLYITPSGSHWSAKYILPRQLHFHQSRCTQSW